MLKLKTTSRIDIIKIIKASNYEDKQKAEKLIESLMAAGQYGDATESEIEQFMELED